MASLLFAGGLLAYEKIKDIKAKKVARKAHNQSRYSDLQSATCICTSLEKVEEGCPVHDLQRKRLEGEEDDGVEEEGEREKGEERRRERGHEGKGMLDGEKERGGMKGGEAPPPRYEDVTTAADGKAGLKERMGRMGRKEDGVVR
ncbi:MAG: hypothetical protein L6R36_007473 [Xanthoria steineri]|nr:MAG: hypothetical protein L6R36_007473 [Xanthoria steineri]